jgi:hypothetical protein
MAVSNEFYVGKGIEHLAIHVYSSQQHKKVRKTSFKTGARPPGSYREERWANVCSSGYNGKSYIQELSSSPTTIIITT